jgi:hypothetical protein
MAAQPVEPAEPEQTPEKPKPVAKKAVAKKATRRRKSGDTAAQEEAAKNVDEAVAPMETEQIPEEREEWFRAPGFQRMKVGWEGEDATILRRAQNSIDQRVWAIFEDALAIMNDLYMIVREQEADTTTGQVKVDSFGFPVWTRDPRTGQYVEDWTLLTNRQKEHFLFMLTTRLVDWEQRSADLWVEAMFAKGIFTERFAIEFDAPMHGTIDDRNARGNVKAAEDRYFAILNAGVSRKAEALVRTLTNLQLRLKDTLGQ